MFRSVNDNSKLKGGERLEKKTSEAQLRANKKWNDKNMKKFTLSMPTDEYDDMKEHIENTGESRNGFIREAIKEAIHKNDNAD